MCLLQVNLIIICIIQTLLWTVPLRKALSLGHDVNPYNYIHTKPIMWENYLCPGVIHTGPTYVQTDLQTANRFQKNSVSSKSQWARRTQVLGETFQPSSLNPPWVPKYLWCLQESMISPYNEIHSKFDRIPNCVWIDNKGRHFL